jgi:phosphopantetheine--protein transferase-like protein
VVNKKGLMIDLFYSCSKMGNELEYPKILYKYFSLEEQAEYSRFKVIKRQFEWISSRIASKKMIRQILKGEKLNFPDIRIQKEETGQPYIYITGQGRLEGKFSLSHSNGFVFCGYSPAKEIKFGLDIEKIEDRTLEFVQDFFTPWEIEKYLTLDKSDNNEYTTMVWSAKEAVLKTMGLGLSIDTRKVEIVPKSIRKKPPGWNECSAQIIISPNLKFKINWQEIYGYIRTICVPEELPVLLKEIRIV